MSLCLLTYTFLPVCMVLLSLQLFVVHVWCVCRFAGYDAVSNVEDHLLYSALVSTLCL